MKRTLKWLGSLALALVLCILIFPALTTEADAASASDLTPALNGMVKEGNSWYYYKNGQLVTEDTLVEVAGELYHIVGGKWQRGENRLYKNDGKYYYLVKGIVNNANKLVMFNNRWYHVKNGTWQQGENGMVKVSGKWYAVKNGIAIMEDTLVEFSGKQYHVKSGYWQEGETRLYSHGGKYYYLVNGIVNKSNKLVKFDNKWYHVKDGIWQQGEHTLFKYSNKWYYLYNGIMNTTDKLFNYSGKWYHVKNGTWQQGENGMVKISGKWYPMKNGVANMADTLFSFDGKLYHIKTGYWQQGEETKLYKYNGEWYYLVNGIVNKSTTVCLYNNKFYYVTGGKWVRTNTTFTYNNNTLKVVNGMVTGANKPTIIQQPESVVVVYGKKATVTVLAVGDGLKYTWYYMDKDQSSYTRTDSFTGNTYSVEMAPSRDGRRVCCVITDKYGNTVKTVAVTLGMSGVGGDAYVEGTWHMININTMEVYDAVYIMFFYDNSCYLKDNGTSHWLDWEYYGYVEGTYVYSIDYDTFIFVVDPESGVAVLTSGDTMFFFIKE